MKRWLWGSLIEETRASSGTERVAVPVDLVLAIDVTGSMGGSLYLGQAATPTTSRIAVVRRAAQSLVAALYDQPGDTSHIAMGLVPFNTTVNIGSSRTGWVSDLGTGHKVIPTGFPAWTSQGDRDPGQVDGLCHVGKPCLREGQ